MVLAMRPYGVLISMAALPLMLAAALRGLRSIRRSLRGETQDQRLRRVAAMLCDYLDPATLTKRPTVKLASPQQLDVAFAAVGCPLPLAKGEPPLSEFDLLRSLALTLEYSVSTGGPGFYNQLYGRADSSSICAEWLVAAANTNCHTFEVAPVFTMAEKYVLERLAEVIGPTFASGYDGLFVPGSSIGNLYALLLARHRVAPQIKTKGIPAAGRLVAFVSEEAHYSFLKSAVVIGIGSDNLVKIPTVADSGMMDTDALRRAIEQAMSNGQLPFFVGATAGTTVVGAFDSLRAVQRVSKEHGLWVHVDAAWGGGVLFSPTRRDLVDGMDACDSMACSLHKMLGATLQCSVFMTSHAGALRACNATSAAYLFQPDKLFADLDLGDKTIQCGRKADGFKLWVLWKSLGDEGLAKRVDNLFSLAQHAVNRIRASEGAFVLAYPPSCTNVCFWYAPKVLRPLREPAALTPQHPVHHVAPWIKAEMQAAGDALIGFQSINGRPNFFRWVFASGDCLTDADVDAVLERIALLGERFPLPPRELQ